MWDTLESHRNIEAINTKTKIKKRTKRNKNQKKKKEIKSCRVIFYFNNKKISVLPTSGH